MDVLTANGFNLLWNIFNLIWLLWTGLDFLPTSCVTTSSLRTAHASRKATDLHVWSWTHGEIPETLQDVVRIHTILQKKLIYYLPAHLHSLMGIQWSLLEAARCDDIIVLLNNGPQTYLSWILKTSQSSFLV